MTYSSLERVKAYTQVEPTDLNKTEEEFNQLIQTLMGSAKDQIDAFCSRNTWGFDLQEEETLHLDGKNGDRKMLHLPAPVHEVQSVEEDGNTLTEGQDYQWKPHGSLIRTGGGKGRRSYGVGSGRQYGSGTPPGLQSKKKSVWSAGYNNVEVTLTFGYHDQPDEPDTWSIEEYALPRDILKAELKLVDHELQGLLSKRENTTVQTDDFEVQANLPVSMTEEIENILAEHTVKRGLS